MKFSLGNIYFNNVSNSYKWLYFKNDYIMNYICIRDFYIWNVDFYGTSYFYDMLKLGGGENLGDISQFELWIMNYVGVERNSRAHTDIAYTCVIPGQYTCSLLDAALKKMVPQNLTTPIKDTLPSQLQSNP